VSAVCVPVSLRAVSRVWLTLWRMRRRRWRSPRGPDVASLPAVVQAGLLRDLERAESAQTAARANVLAVFTAQLGSRATGTGGPVVAAVADPGHRGAAGGAVGWARRLAAHPLVAAALAGGQVSTSWARHIWGVSEILCEGVINTRRCRRSRG